MPRQKIFFCCLRHAAAATPALSRRYGAIYATCYYAADSVIIYVVDYAYAADTLMLFSPPRALTLMLYHYRHAIAMFAIRYFTPRFFACRYATAYVTRHC